MKISSNLKLGYTTGGSSRGARRRGLAGSGRIRCQHSACLSRKQSFCAFSKNIDNHSFDYFPRNTCRIKNTFRVGSERRAEQLGKFGQDWVPTKLFVQETKLYRCLQGVEETTLQHPSRSTNKQESYVNRRRNEISGLPLVHQRFITRTVSALRPWLPNNGTTPFCLCKPLSCKACPGTKQHKQANSHLHRWRNETIG